MKKTLIALAVLASSGASFAQVSITGQVIAEYAQGRNAAGDETAGFGIETSKINFLASEDLGGGMKVDAGLALDGVTRSNSVGSVAGAASSPTGAVTAGDATLKLTTSVGTFGFANVRFADYMSGGLTSGMGVKMDGKVFPNRVYGEDISYSNKFGPVVVSLSQNEADYRGNSAGSIASGGQQAGTAGLASTTGQRRSILSGTYVAGPLVANLGYLSYDSNNLISADVSALRGAATYDFGVAKLGAVVSQSTKRKTNSTTDNMTITDYLLGVSVPMGATTLSANYASRKLSDSGLVATTADTTNTGASVRMDYALSKRTVMGLYYSKWQARTVGLLADTTDSTLVQANLSHSF